MKKEDFKRVIDQIEPDEKFAERLQQSLVERAAKERSEQRKPFFLREHRLAPFLASALGVVILVGMGSLLFYNKQDAPHPPHPSVLAQTQEIVYDGQKYLAAGSSFVTEKQSERLQGKKIGYVDDGRHDASIYQVKGYDPSYRVMVANQLYENFEQMKKLNGAQLFEKLAVTDNVSTAALTASTDDYQKSRKITPSDVLQYNGVLKFIDSFMNSKELPLNQVKSAKEAKLKLQLTLNDGTVVNVRLSEDGQLIYGTEEAQVVYQIDKRLVQMLWTFLQ
jgi:hypothetical protein